MNDETTAAPQNTNEKNTASAPSDDEVRVEKLARKYRHIGYTIMGGLALAVCAFLLYTVITSINNETVIDSQTGQPVYAK